MFQVLIALLCGLSLQAQTLPATLSIEPPSPSVILGDTKPIDGQVLPGPYFRYQLRLKGHQRLRLTRITTRVTSQEGAPALYVQDFTPYRDLKPGETFVTDALAIADLPESSSSTYGVVVYAETLVGGKVLNLSLDFSTH